MREHENGSVLIEAMVAAAIIALMLGTMYGSIGDTAMRERVVTQKRMALLIAQSEMDAVGSVLPLTPGATGGVDGAYAWRVDIQPYSVSQAAGTSGPLFQVTVSVRENGGNVALVTLKSLTLGPVS
jgi:type II secretory pathway component PulK